MQIIFYIIFIVFLSQTAYAGMDFSMLSKKPYIAELSDFKANTIDRLKEIIQQVGESKEVHRKVEAITKDMNNLAIEAGKTMDDKNIALQEEVEEILKFRLYKIIDKYEAGDKAYFDAVAETITELKKFNIPVGAMVYAGCEVTRRKISE